MHAADLGAWEAEVFFTVDVWTAEERATFLGFLEEGGVPAKNRFLHDEGALKRDECGSTAEENVFGDGDNVGSEDNGEEPLD